MMVSLLFTVAMAAGAPAKKSETAVFSFGFGTHVIERIELSRQTIKGRSVWIGRYLIGDRLRNQRVLPAEIAEELDGKLARLFKENKKDIPLLGLNGCAGRMIYEKAGASNVYCTDLTSALAQKRITEWIREAQGLLEIKPLK